MPIKSGRYWEGYSVGYSLYSEIINERADRCFRELLIFDYFADPESPTSLDVLYSMVQHESCCI